MIVLFTDFGSTDPYVGQMHAAIRRIAPDVPIIDLLHTVPDFDIRAGAYLLPTLAAEFPSGTIFVCVVDPGVGSDRAPVFVTTEQHVFIGPDNGLFHIVARRARQAETRVIQWRGEKLSHSFHGRDLFAPFAAHLARSETLASAPTALTSPAGDWPEDLPAIIFIDHYGNAITGLRANTLDRSAIVKAAGLEIRYAPVFSAAPTGKPFWYENSIGLVEIAVNSGSAAQVLNLSSGAPVSL